MFDSFLKASQIIETMAIIKHRFLEHKINPFTETLIIGTFNPDAEENDAEFFYGRSKNYLWKLLPVALGQETLKGKSKKEKLKFIKENKIDFIDLISEVNVDEGEEANYEDKYIDDKITEWRCVIDEIVKLKYLRRVAFTRKTLTDIPQMKLKIKKIQRYCIENRIPFYFLKTPARTYSASKQQIWSSFFNNDN